MQLRAFIFLWILPAAAMASQSPAANRILRNIDFEERRLGNPEELPMHWTKVAGAGMPHYVNGQLATDCFRSGRYSFRFDLNGGSLAYRYDPGQIKVQPRAHYRVEAFVRTTILPNARARLTAYFTDEDRKPIVTSMRHSELYAARREDEPWKQLQLELTADSHARSLVMELALLQPAAYSAGKLGDQALYPQDIRGSAWFDDITVSQVPKVKMSTQRAGNIFRQGDALALTVLVNDRSTDDLAAQLVIRNAEGKTVYQRSGALDMSSAEELGPSLKRMRLVLPDLAAGWYEAALVMTSQGQFVGRQSLHLVQLADAAVYRPDERFGIIATDLGFDGWSELPDILPYLSAGRVKLALWNRHEDLRREHAAMFDQLLVRLGELKITPTACLIDLPPGIAGQLKAPAWSELLGARAEVWQPQLAYMVSRHANHLDRWQLGADGTDAFVINSDMRRVYDLLYGEFSKLMQKPDLAMPWPAWAEMSGELPATIALSVHPSVLPHRLPLYMQEMGQHEGHNLALTLQLLDRDRYGRELQIRDLAQRVIYALSAGASRIDVPLPFTVAREDGDLVKQPQELLMILRTLTSTLGSATFKGKVPVAEGVEAFLFDRDGVGILALWDQGTSGGTRELSLSLGQKPRAIDLWGNVTPLLRVAGNATEQVRLAVGPTPMFLVDIDGQLAQMRASVRFDRPLIESSFQPHTRKVRFGNPYGTAMAGSLRLKGPAGWSIKPPVLAFNVNPGETFEQDVVIEFPYNSYAGNKLIEAELKFQDARVAATIVPLTLRLGLSDVGMQTMAIRDGKDILVQQTITNYGDAPIDYTAFCIAPGHPREERLVTNLAPGRSTIKLYRLPDAREGTQKIRTGVKQLQGTRILNDEVEVQ